LAKEECGEACYDCLMSYGNQGDHALLSRFTVKDLLTRLASATVETSGGPSTPEEHLAALLARSESELEKRWLRFLAGRGLHLPSRAQVYLEASKTRPDFIYDRHQTVVYVDGPSHQFPDRETRDRELADLLEDQGWLVVRFAHDENWAQVVAKYPSIFGQGK
jgi:very-short-patch-repair endonuclease